MEHRVGSGGYDAAWSTLLWLENDWSIEPQPMWITSLSHWQQALSAQDKIDKNQQATMYSSFNLRMICCEQCLGPALIYIDDMYRFLDHALGDYQKGYDLAQNFFEGLDDNERRNTAHWATAAAWHMVKFPTLAVRSISDDFFREILIQWQTTLHFIPEAQVNLCTKPSLIYTMNSMRRPSTTSTKLRASLTMSYRCNWKLGSKSRRKV